MKLNKLLNLWLAYVRQNLTDGGEETYGAALQICGGILHVRFAY